MVVKSAILYGLLVRRRGRVLNRHLGVSFVSAALVLAANSAAWAGPAGVLSGSYDNWTGFYLGGTVGGAWGSLNPTTSTSLTGIYFPDAATLGAVNAAGAQSFKTRSVPIGLEAGYNWQKAGTPWVFGIEGDVQSLRLSGDADSGSIVYPGFAPTTFNVSSASSANWLFTLRPRVGWARDNWLFYGTGGVAVTRLNSQFAFFDQTGTAASGNFSRTRLGYAAGGGVEVGLGNGWSVKGEYLFVDVSSGSVVSDNLSVQTAGPGFSPTPGQPFTHSVDLKTSIARLGLNYRFDAAQAASEAGLPTRVPPMLTHWSWSGLYVGAHGGAAGGTTHFDDPFGQSIFGDNARTPVRYTAARLATTGNLRVRHGFMA